MSGFVASAVRQGVARANGKRRRVERETCEDASSDHHVEPSTPLASCQSEAITPDTPRMGGDTAASISISSDETPCKPSYKRRTEDSPKPADRYRIVEQNGVEVSNPHKFCLKPPFWRRWRANHYARLADDIRSRYDPVPIAREFGLTVEEVRAVFYAVVCKPLYHAKEAVGRGEEGIMELAAAYTQYGTPTRRWREGTGRTMVGGELDSVADGYVVVVGEMSGNKYSLGLDGLSEADVEYLRDALAEEELRVLGLPVNGEARVLK
ncbi:hypothetical protein B0A50_03199 [Salinomyces thailandicus]|uniref:Uncharacterized protein n=1 Tax=Salinomyces thailandicus TaxID=706561 RepID=A0A4U0U6L6_9PEZI|nr:hypothetical protein B0A50_03199 [Salinomyces thailandica]